MAELLNQADEAYALRLASSQPESGVEWRDFLDRLREKVVAAALEDGRLQARLGRCRYRVLTADYREDKLDGDQIHRLAEVGVYDYDQDVLVITVVDLTSGAAEEVFDRGGRKAPGHR